MLLNLPETHNLDRIKGALSVSLIFPFVPHNSAVSLTSTRNPPTHHAILTEPSTSGNETQTHTDGADLETHARGFDGRAEPKSGRWKDLTEKTGGDKSAAVSQRLRLMAHAERSEMN